MDPFGAPNVEAFMGGVGVGLVVVLWAVLLVCGVNVIRRFFSS
jgi:hypothetical protein